MACNGVGKKTERRLRKILKNELKKLSILDVIVKESKKSRCNNASAI